MRDVKSRNYFEQMKGRGTRTLDHDELKKVTPSAKTAKTHYVIVDAIGVTKSLKTASQPLITKPSVPLKDLAMGIMMGVSDTDTVSSLAGRLARLNKQLDNNDKKRIEKASGGVSITQMVVDLFSAIDGDKVEEQALILAEQPKGTDPGEDNRNKAQAEMVSKAANVFNGELIELIDTIRRDKDQKIDHDNIDEVEIADWEKATAEQASDICKDFADYLQQNKDEITALEIYYDQPHRRREITFDMVKEVLDKLKSDKPKLAPLNVWQAYEQVDTYKGNKPINELTALLALIRRVVGIDDKLATFDATVSKNFQTWIMKHHSGSNQKFTKEQMVWLQMIRDHFVNSFHFELDDLEMSPFDAQGGLGKMYQLFGNDMNTIIDELNSELVA
jgi:type I restriction enzyme R subunit